MMCLRSVIALVIYMVYMCYRLGESPEVWQRYKATLTNWRHVLILVIYGNLLNVTFLALAYAALYVSVMVMGLIQATVPMVTFLLDLLPEGIWSRLTLCRRLEKGRGRAITFPYKIYLFGNQDGFRMLQPQD